MYLVKSNHRPLEDVILKYISVAVCVLGVVFNMFILAVRSRREMASPTNFILTSLAIVDSLLMISYASFIFVNKNNRTLFMSFGVRCPSLILVLFDIIRHGMFYTSRTMSIWLTVALAVIRYRASRRCLTNYVITKKQAKVIVLSILMASCIVTGPRYFYTIEKYDDDCYTVKALRHRSMFIAKLEIVLRIINEEFWPFFLLTLFTGLLIRQIRNGNRYRNRLVGVSISKRDSNRGSKTTKMLMWMIFFLNSIRAAGRP